MKATVSYPPKEILVRTFYCFTSLEQKLVNDLKGALKKLGSEQELSGSIILAQEGCNGTVAGKVAAIDLLFKLLNTAAPHLLSQDSWVDSHPFNRFKVVIKEQIVSARDRNLGPAGNHGDQLNAQEWDEVRELVRQGAAQMLDVRNSYEVAIGSFPEARNPNTATFKEFSDFLDKEVGETLDPELPTAIFCTGGIRCEKARIDLERRGFRKVLQLHKGILGYLKQQPAGGFAGECFVFDKRVALDSKLEPSYLFELCPSCGEPRSKSGKNHSCPKATS